MPPEDDVDYAEVRDAPSEGQGDSSVAALARDGQNKTDDQQDQEKNQEEARKNYDTASSVDLPRISFDFEDGGLIAKVGDKKVKMGPPEEGGLRSKAGNGEAPEIPTGLMDPPAAGGQRADLPLGELSPEEVAKINNAVKDGGVRADLPLGELSPEQIAQINKAAGDGGLRADLPLGELSPEQIAQINKAAGDGGVRAERPPEGKEGAPEAKPEAKPDADKLLEKFKNYTPKEQRQLRQDLADIDKLPKEQREKVYASLDKIARNDEHPGDKVKLTGEQSRELVKSLAHQIAHPESIKQGENMTCTVASAEQTLARTHPEVYADMVSKLATEGQYTTADGKTIKAQGAENGKLDPKSDAFGQRSYTSELFQNGAVQLGLDKNQEYKAYAPGDPRAIPRPEGVTAANDRGERVIDNNTNPPTVKDFTGFKAEKQAEILNHLVPGDKYGQTKPITTPAELEAALKQNGGPPMQVGINLEGAKDFSGMNRSEANHAVVITKIENGKVYYDNAAGGADHSHPHGEGVPVDKFVDSMKQGQMRAITKGAGDAGGSGEMGAPSSEAGAMGNPDSKATADAPAAAAAHDGSARKPGDGGPKPGDGPVRQGTTVVEKPTDAPVVDKEAYEKIQNDPRVLEAQENLNETIDKRMEGLRPDDPKRKELEQMKQDMEAFEKRAAAMKPPLSPEEVAKTEEAILKLMKENPNAKIDQAGRQTIAMQAMHHAAYPQSIDQGKNSTCNVTTAESRMYTKNPSAAVEMVADVATTGQFETKPRPGKVVTVDAESLKKHGETSMTNPPEDGARSYDSQIFQVAAVNIGHAENGTKIGGKEFPPGSLEYRQREKQAGMTPPDETGEVLVDKKTGEPIRVNSDTGNLVEKKDGKYVDSKTGQEVDEKKARPVTHPSLDDGQIPPVYEKITGQPPEKGVYLANSDYTDDKSGRVTQFKNAEEMKQQIEQAKAEGKLPITIKVNAGQEPYFTDSGGGKAGGSDGPHVVTITDIDKNGNIVTDNQWGSGADRKTFTPEELFKATKSSADHIKDLEKECADNAKKGTIDYSKEAELLRMKRYAGDPPMSEGEYERHLIQITKQAVQDAKSRDGQMDEKTRTELASMLNQIKADNPQNYEIVRANIGGGAVDRLIGSGTPGRANYIPPDGDFRKVDVLEPTKEAAAAAKEVSDSLNLWNQPERLEKALKGKSPAEIAAMDSEFKKTHNGQSMEDYIKKETKAGSDEQNRALALLNPGSDSAKTDLAVSDFRKATKRDDLIDTGTDEQLMLKSLEGKTKSEIEAMDKAYKDKYGRSLKEEIESELGGEDKAKALKALEGSDAKQGNTATGSGGGDAKAAGKPGEGGGGKASDGTMGGPDSKDGAPKGDAPKVDAAKAAQDADKIFEAKGVIDDDEEAVYKALEGKNAQEIKAMEAAFKKNHPDAKMSMEEYMMSFMDEGKEQAKVKELLEKARAKDAGGDKPADKPAESPGNSPEDQKKCAEAKKDLEGDIDSKVKDANQRKFMKEEIEKFEKREPPVSAKERAEFYGHIDKLIEAKDPPPRADLPKEAERQKLALQVLEQANKPGTVDQGPHSTCGTASMESRLYTKNPAAVARAVSEVATTGKLTPQPPGSGPAVDVHPSVLKPDAEAKGTLKFGTGDGRSYASQIFQGSATTLEREGYRQDAKVKGKDTGDTGERYKNGSSEENFAGLSGKEVSSIERKLTGVTDDSKAPPIIEGYDANDTDVSGSQYPGRIAIRNGNEAELKSKLQELKKDGKLPVMVAVDTAQEPFASDASGRAPDGAGGKHFVTITDIDENGNVCVDNQWGAPADHNGGTNGQKGKVPVSQLSKALGHS